MGGVRQRIVESAAAFRSVFANTGLRRLELAWAASILGNWAYLVAVSVYAYGVGGEAAVGLLLLLRLVPAGLLAPFAGLLADRHPRERVLLVANLARLVLMVAAALCVFADAAPAVVYALAIATSIANTPFRSAQAALTPTLARSPSELTAANAVASTIESLAAFAGPAFAGILLGFVSIGTVFVIDRGARRHLGAVRAGDSPRTPHPRAATSKPRRSQSEALVGFKTVVRDPSLRVLVGLFTAQTFVAGAVQVYLVVTAIELLDMGPQGVGYLNAAVGIGALVGGLSRSRLPEQSVSAPPSWPG